MSAKDGETTRNPIVSIPGLLEMERLFDQPLITGSSNPLIEFDDYYASRFRRNITEAKQETRNDVPQYFSLLQPSGPSSWKNIPQYKFLRIEVQEDTTKTARLELEHIVNKEIAKRATRILDVIQDQIRNYELVNFPPIRIAELDDGSIILEWGFEHFRTGFNIEENSDESGYFLISDQSAGEIRSSGYLKGLKPESIIRSILTLILNN